MKCPKCGYLAFESNERCRNCGYEFSLARSGPGALDFALDPGPEHAVPPLDLDRLIGGDAPEAIEDLPLFPPPNGNSETRPSRRPGAIGRADPEDAPLIAAGQRPRAPLGVRRATPEVPRARPRPARESAQADDLFDDGMPAVATPGQTPMAVDDTREALAGPGRRLAAASIDAVLLCAVDGLVLYFTLRLLGLTVAQTFELPLVPLAAFFLLLNGGYFVAFTAVGGQSIGKMAAGIKVIGQEDEPVPVGRATLRTLACFASALPLGAGFLPGVFAGDGLALHDRLAHTRVVRPTST